MDTASCSALSNELILDHVLHSVNDPASLARCALVNSVWYRRSTPVLWRGSNEWLDDTWRTPDIGFLSRLAEEPGRIQFYLGFVRFLDLHYSPSPCGSSLFHVSTWSTAKPISAKVDIGSDLMTEENITPLLQLNLKSLELFGGYYSDGFLDELRTRAPNLINLLLDNRSDKLTSQGLLNYLEQMPQIRFIELEIGFELVITERILIHLMNRPNLEHLSLGSVATLTKYVVSMTDHDAAAKSLRSLQLRRIEGGAARSLLPRMTQLEALRLDLDDSVLNLSADIISSLSYCSQIRELVLILRSDTILNTEDLSLVAKSCPALQSLDISGDISVEFRNKSANPIQPQGIAELAKRLSKLENLCIEFPSKITITEFAEFGRNCPRLDYLSLNTSVELLELRGVADGILFTSLKDLDLRSFTTSLPATAANDASPAWRLEMENLTVADQLEDIILEKMPVLSHLAVAKENTREHSVAERLNGRLQSRTKAPSPHPSVQHELLVSVLCDVR